MGEMIGVAGMIVFLSVFLLFSFEVILKRIRGVKILQIAW